MSQTREEIITLAQRWMGLWQGVNPGAFDELHHPEFIDHSPSGRASDREGFRQGIQALYRAFPDCTAEIEDLVIDPVNGKASIRWAAVGTHRGSFLGVRPTGRQVHFSGIEIIAVRDHQVVARWGEWDGLDIMEQLASMASDRARLAHHVLTILAVNDLQEATRFYDQAFGWPVRVEAPVYVEFALPDGRGFGLYQREGYARNTGRLPATLDGDDITGTEVYLHCPDIDDAIERLRVAGARELSSLAARDWGDEAAYFADPDGNVLVVARPLAGGSY